ncbi:uncharacterized protein BROUX77_001168 [Berkeleyomyces rouxiae]|uniref:uncharacterized protein n=1 Tax=Berkeleyomyces rouxiae TaxID=2035830 RepID=UPI003B7DF1D8
MFCLRSHNWFIPRLPVGGSSPGSCLYGCPQEMHSNVTSSGVDGGGYANGSVHGGPGFDSTVLAMANETAAVLAKALVDEAARKRAEWTGLGMEWLRSLLGEREWRVDFLDIYIRL